MSSNATYTNGATQAIKEPARPTAFIAAPLAVDTSVIRDSLSVRGYEAVGLDDVNAGGRSIPEILKDLIGKAEIVVAVIGDEVTARNIFYEVGFAQALDKRILALSPSGLLPPTQGIAYLTAQPSNREAIDFGLDQILAAPKPGSRPLDDAGERTHPIGDLADKLLAESRHDDLTERELSFIVSRALEASGVRIRAEHRLRGVGFVDIAVWSDDIEPWIRNPLLIELKERLVDESDVQDAVSQVSKYLQAANADRGLIICREIEINLASKSQPSDRVFVVSLERFLDALRTCGFGDYVVGLCRQRVRARG